MGIYGALMQALNRQSLVYAVVYTLVFLVLSVAWILLSDHMAGLAAQTGGELAVYQRYKGLFYVTGVGLIFGVMTYMAHRRGIMLDRALLALKTDTVTGLTNRPVAEALLNERLAVAIHAAGHCGVLLFDIRNLKRINNAYGHAGGDQLLRHVARWLRQLTRATDYVARMEGDRFLVILTPLSDQDELVRLGHHIQNAIPPLNIEPDKPIEIELNGGAAMAPENGRTAFELLDVAERALIRIKQSGQKFGLVKQDDLVSDDSLLELESLLRRAIRENQFSVAFQPIVDVKTFELHGAEVLARWQPPGRDAISPGQFIPLAESLGLVQDITEQVFSLTAYHVAAWHGRHQPCQLNLNLSGLDLVSDRILATTNRLIANSQLEPAAFTLEITESWFMEDRGLVTEIFESLRNEGFNIAIDDFGTGYSALGQLLEFPLSEIKIDQSFTAGCAQSTKKQRLIQLIQGIADSLGVETTAEGVETMEDLRVIKRLGVEKAQGFLFARPMSPEAFVDHFLEAPTSPFQKLRDALQEPVSP